MESDNYNEIKKTSVIIEDLLSLSQEKFAITLDQIISDKKIGNNYKISGVNYTIIIKPTNSSYYKDHTNINFENCEKKLRNKKIIPDSSILSILQIEIYNDNNQSLINQVEYRIYNENKDPIDISVCKDTDITIFHSMNDNILSLLNKDLVLEFKDLGINILDINDPFFSDICIPLDYHDIDIVLEDRHNIIYQNFSLCEKGCNNTNIDFENKFVECQCKVKQNINNKIMEVEYQQFDKDKLKSTNIDVLKCTELIFQLSNKSKNIGFISFLVLLILNIILIIIHMIKGIKSVSDFVYEEMTIYSYLKIGDRKFFERKQLNKITILNNVNSSNSLIII